MPKQPAADQLTCSLKHTAVPGPAALKLPNFESRATVNFVYALNTPHRQQGPCFELAVDRHDGHAQQDRPNIQHLLKHRPQALLSLLPRPVVLFTAGAVSGAIGKTLTAPLDRVKLLLQTSGGLQQGAVKHAVRKGGVWKALVAIGRTEGIKGYWKGNLPQVSLSAMT